MRSGMWNLLKQEFSDLRGSLRFPAADDVLRFFYFYFLSVLKTNGCSKPLLLYCFFFKMFLPN